MVKDAVYSGKLHKFRIIYKTEYNTFSECSQLQCSFESLCEQRRPMQQTNLENALDRGLDYLYHAQLPSGEFKSYWSTHPTMKDECTVDHSPFPTALIAYCLSFVDHKKANEIIEKAVDFLQQEMLPGGVWKYWTDKHPYYKNIPPDADDTACVCIVLKQNGIDISESTTLLQANRDSLGRLYTWFVPRLKPIACTNFWRVVLSQNLFSQIVFFAKHEAAQPDDVDGVVNANGLACLGESPATEPIIKYLIEIVEKKQEGKCDKWHLSPINFYYAISRCYFTGVTSLGTVKEKVIDRIESQINQDYSIGNNVLDTAMAYASLLNWGVAEKNKNTEKSINYIVENQAKDGSWEKYPIYYGGPQYAGPDDYFAWGSETITTAFCLEGLSRFQRM